MTSLPPLWLLLALVVVGLIWSGKQGTRAKRLTFAALGVFFVLNALLNPGQRYPSLLCALVAAGYLVRQQRSPVGSV